MWIQDALAECIRKALSRPDLAPETIMGLGAMIWLLKRLPVHHEQYTAVLCLSKDDEDGGHSWDVQYSDMGLSLSDCVTVRDTYGSDRETNKVWTVTQAGSEHAPGLPVFEWMETFRRVIADPTFILTIDLDPPDEMPSESAEESGVDVSAG